jgi:RHS repeat-associated protein
MVAIPGMNPGLFVMGGGGDGGGGDGGDGSGDKNKQGANGKNGGKDANGGGKGAGNCGAGSGAGRCPTHSPKTAGGDPVDAVTGRVYTTPEADLYLPGLLPLVFLRSYRSGDDPRDIGMGYGWSHTFAWSIEEHRRNVVVTTDDATRVLMERPDVGAVTIGRDGWVLRREPGAYELEAESEPTRVFTPHATEEGLFVLSAIRDRNGNQIEIRYDRGALVEAIDSVGRVLRFRSAGSGRIGSIEVRNAAAQARWIAFATYRYDDRGDLVCVTDADGVSVYFGYDEDHLLTSVRYADGVHVHFVYDAQRRCVETWADHADPSRLALAANVPDVLADGKTRAKGILHTKLEYFTDGYTEVIDSVRVRRVFGNEFGSADKHDDGGRVVTWDYDDYGNPVRHTDALGATTIWKRDERGRILARTDAVGRTHTFVRDGRGEIVEVTGPDGTSTQIQRNAAGNVEAVTDPIGRTVRFVRAPNGLLTDKILATGARWQYRYDAHANLVELIDPNGGSTRWEHDELGRTTAYTNVDGRTWRFHYTDLGRLLAEVAPNGGSYRRSYEPRGRCCQIVDPDGRSYRVEWGHLSRVTAIIEPDGRTQRVLFNREGWTTELRNARGDAQTYELDTAGYVVAEHTFDGRTRVFERDAMGRTLRFDAGNGEWAEMVYDATGALVSREYDDGAKEVFEHDSFGRLARVASDAVEITYERDAAGQIVRERVAMDGRTFTIDRRYDGAGELLGRRSSLGHEAELRRDPLGNPLESLLDGSVVRHARDGLGRERRRLLPAAGEIDFDYDSIGNLVHYAARRPSAAAGTAPGPNEPVWVGQAPVQPPSIERTFEFSLRPNKRTRMTDLRLGVEDHQFDAAGRLVGRVVPKTGTREEWGYDEDDNVFEANQGLRTYGPGDRLLRHGNTELSWDGAGRLIERRETTDSGVLVTRYEWGTKGDLRAVIEPGGRRVEFDYDPFMRRVAKRVLEPGEDGKPALVSKVAFLWDRDNLLHEIREKAAAAGDPVVEERTYAFADQELVPLAQRDVVRKGESVEPGDWYHYVVGPTGETDFLVASDGREAWGRTHDLWGKTETESPTLARTPLRFRGQYEDEETRLAYNRHRYYDPSLGRYISADPIDVRGGFNVYGYGTDPSDLADVFGLDPTTHFADAEIVHSDGRPPTPLGSFNSTQQDQAFQDVKNDPDHRWADKVASPKYQNNDNNYASGLNSMLSHTEKKICTAARDQGIGPGDTLKIKGSLPPCSTCQAFMKDLHKDTGANVEYHHDGPDSPWRYPPS